MRKSVYQSNRAYRPLVIAYRIVDSGDLLERLLMLLLGVTVRGRPCLFDIERSDLLPKELKCPEESEQKEIAESAVEKRCPFPLVSLTRCLHSSPHPREAGRLANGNKGASRRSSGNSPGIEVDFGNGFLLMLLLTIKALGFSS